MGPRGTFQASGNLSTSPADIDELFSHLEGESTERVVLHFHGGLVSEEAGDAIARKLYPIYKEASTHPVTFVWETGLLETVERNLVTIGSTQLFKKLLAYALKHVAKRLGGVGGRGVGEPLEFDYIEAELAAVGAVGSVDAPFAGFDAAARGGRPC